MPQARLRTKARIIECMLKIMTKRIANSAARITVHHANELAKGEKLKSVIGSRFSCSEPYITKFSFLLWMPTLASVFLLSPFIQLGCQFEET